jgi:hypothetical protein
MVICLGEERNHRRLTRMGRRDVCGPAATTKTTATTTNHYYYYHVERAPTPPTSVGMQHSRP